MSKVVAHMSMSLDGYVADPSDGCEELFGWYGNGEVEVPSNDPRWTFHVSAASAPMLREAFDGCGALVCGRRLFDHTKGWGGNHPTGAPLFVVTHRPIVDWPHPVTFVTDGVASAIEQAKQVAGDKVIAAASTTVVQQCLDLDLLDEIQVNLVPVLMGEGIPFFPNLTRTPVRLTDPEVIAGKGVTHLRYQVEH
ncbi:MAG: dihydrofolate reductase family protein [Actinophytocola sp.]|uniref:dihydrofolate reductase family protein n=1 Tax=Actinophytocola sp. TaxID=1872138 RepID=UPI003D6C151B